MGDFVVPDGMPASVFRDKYARLKEDGTYQSWVERIEEVVDGNCALTGVGRDERDALLRHACSGLIPFSGRHVQHGDLDQPGKSLELFSNCSTAMFSWASFLLLMKGSGVGRDYSADMCFVDWDYLPSCRFVLEAPDNQGRGGHPDYELWIEALSEAQQKYDPESEAVRWHEVADSAEGWARVVMVMETAAFHKNNRDTIFVFDFSKVRRAGAPLRGQQNRPASGPVPFIRALNQIMSLKGAGMKPWKQAMFIDHYLAACVVVGGVRRSARIAVKSCYDKDAIDFIDIKRGGFLWSANNSIAVDNAFWLKAADPRPSLERRVYEAAGGSSYWDDTGEPGFINVDRLHNDERGLDTISSDSYLSQEFIAEIGGLHRRTREMIDYHLQRALKRKYKYVVNPCGEIALAVWGAYCIIGDLCLANAPSYLSEIMGAGILLAKSLVRVNTMRSIYRVEVLRTNRIGVSLTGIHEFMWRHFNITMSEATACVLPAARAFWLFLEQLRGVVERAADQEADRLGLPHPATVTTIKPSGTISKVMQCTEGAHLPANRHYVRWVAFSKTDPKLEEFGQRGYPMKDVSAQYADTVVVGFPTCLPIVEEIPLAFLRTASEVSPEDQYAWVRLLEKHWLGPRGNQVSYTNKWRKNETSYEDYMRMLLREQPTVRCCSLMPQIDQDASAYAYLPEEPISEEVYREMMSRIRPAALEAYNSDQLECEGGVCPIEEDIHDDSIGVRAAAD
ncbi:MAG: ribonucleoside-diphosphate reductase [Elusimicrobia bacterium]|nr:ribonucleoside-diphosphate reductase [Elusimicrobiota bacterium]